MSTWNRSSKQHGRQHRGWTRFNKHPNKTNFSTTIRGRTNQFPVESLVTDVKPLGEAVLSYEYRSPEPSTDSLIISYSLTNT